MPRSVRGRFLFHVVHILAARYVVGNELREQAKPLRLRAALQQKAAEIEIVDALGEAEAEIVAGALPRRRFAFADLALQTLVSFQRAIQQLARNLLGLLVVEVLDLAAQISLLVVQRHDAETPPAAGDHVEAAIRIPVDDRFHGDRTAGTGNAVFLFGALSPLDGAHDAELGSGGFGLAHHFPVTLFENMQRQGGAGEHDKLEREEREQSCHASIVHRRIHSVFLATVFCALAQNSGVTGGATGAAGGAAVAPGGATGAAGVTGRAGMAGQATAPIDNTLSNLGEPMKVRFTCGEEELAAAGMSCSDDDPCPVYLELSGVSAVGKKLSLAGNLHGPSATLDSVLLTSDDAGANWKEPVSRIPGAALDQVQLSGALHGWAAGETQYPLARDPFFLITVDGGISWRRESVTEEGGAGAVQRFWFDAIDHGELIVDAGRTAQGGRYVMYESRTGGDSWTIVSKTAQMPRLRRAPAVDDVDYRIATDSRSHAYVVEKREGERWNRLASFLVQVASCGSPKIAPPPPEPPASPEPPADGK